MQSLKLNLFLFIAVLVFAAKPFVGFSLYRRIPKGADSNILVKAFAKRKQEYTEDSEFNIATIQHRIANPVVTLSLLFSFLLDLLYPALLLSTKAITDKFIADIRLSISPPEHSYLLTGTLLI